MISHVSELREWVGRNEGENASEEWMEQFPYWDQLYTSIWHFLDSKPSSEWLHDDIADLLYAIEIDQESETISERLAQDAEALLLVARYCLDSKVTNGRWQIAAYLGVLGSHKQEAENALIELSDDTDEYVRRRAVLSLGALKSGKAELAAIKAWESRQEYLQIAALSTLAAVESPLLPCYLQMARNEGSEMVAQKAKELQLGC